MKKDFTTTTIMIHPIVLAVGCCIAVALSQCRVIDAFVSPQSLISPASRYHHAVDIIYPMKSFVVSAPRMTSQSDNNNDDNNSSSAAASTTTTSVVGFSLETLEEAQDALASVGWAPPRDDGALTSDDPFVKNINAGILRDVGVELDDLLNPAKVVNLERELYILRRDLALATGKIVSDSLELTTEDCDGGQGGEEVDSIRKAIAKKESDLFVERRSVFRGWLKTVFVVQAIISFGVSYVMATNPSSLFGGYDWFYSYNMDVSIRVLGYWFWWLFVVPSLRSRRPTGPEKKALDIAFLGTPLISILAPIATKDTGVIWAANFLVVAASYGYAFLLDSEDGSDDDKEDKQPDWLRFIYKSLDFGTGRERGARK